MNGFTLLALPSRRRTVATRFVSGVAILAFAFASFPSLELFAQIELADEPPISSPSDRIVPQQEVEPIEVDEVFGPEHIIVDDWTTGSCLTCNGCQSGCCQHTCTSIHCREQLFGNLGCLRPALACRGISLDIDSTNFYYGVMGGGAEQQFRYAGRQDTLINFDLNKLGGPQGLFLKVRAEQRWGIGIGESTGALLTPNVAADLPYRDRSDLYLTNFLFTQMLSETFGVFAGKLDTFDGDANDFASGRGKTQFSNVGFVVTPIGLRTVVYSTLGAGFTVLDDGGEPVFTFSALNATDTANSAGFDRLFEEGIVLVPELRVKTSILGMPGHQLFGGSWSSRSYASFGEDSRTILPTGAIPEQSGSWSLYWNFDQYLVRDCCNPERGWGVFGRAGVADDETNPIESFLSFGIGGDSLLPGRDLDTFGIGWFRSETSSNLQPIISNFFGPVGDGQGVEVYYNYAVTPWCRLTADFQAIDPARQQFDTAWLAGLRAQIKF